MTATFPAVKPKFFATPAAFRAWLEKNHLSTPALLVGLHKKDSGKPSITWPQSVDEALCFGWIDGVRKRLNDESYTIRFTPRRPTSTWSAINIARVGELATLGRMRAAGLAAFERRTEDKSRTYAYEQRRNLTLQAAHRKAFHANKNAWKFFQSQAPSYRHTAIYWVASAKKEETKLNRLEKLIAASAAGRRA